MTDTTEREDATMNVDRAPGGFVPPSGVDVVETRIAWNWMTE
jgi:hypothetical protein